MTDPAPSTDEPSCPNCGSPIPDEAPHGLCPRCVLSGAATLPDAGTGTGRGGAPAAATRAVSEVAAAFPDLAVEELVGSGGMGAVYRARQPKLDRPVALKILSGALARDPAFAERFNREARVLARLNHPNIVTVFDFGTRGEFCFLLMEFVDGVNLRQAMRAGGFTPAESLALVQDVCAALQFAHDEGVLHRDIKPENILIDSRGRVKIADFGIAKLIGEGAASSGDGITLTAQGAVLGSPHYMAPEQIEHPGDVDQRADVYSLGVVFYELLTGELPIGRFSPPSEKSTADTRVDEVVMRALEKERQRRYQSAGEVRTRVEEITAHPTPTAPAGAPPPPVPAPAPAPVPSPSSSSAAPAVTARGEGGPARFATASAVATGASLALAALLGLGVLAVASGLAAGHWAGLAELGILAGITVLFVAFPALVGLVFGLVALRDVRASGGKKPGLGRAMFGALAWPFLLVVGLVSLATGMASAAALGPGLFWLVVATAAAAAAGVLVVVPVWRWARAVPRGTGWRDPQEREHAPGTVAAVAAVLSGAVALGVLVPWGAFTLTRAGHLTEPARPDPSVTTRQPEGEPPGSTGDRTPWRSGRPEIELLIGLPARHVATVALVHRDAAGHEHPLDFRGYAIASDDRPFEGNVRIGATGNGSPPDGSPDHRWVFRFAHPTENRNVPATDRPYGSPIAGGAVVTSSGTLSGDWRFDTAGVPNRLDLASAGEHSFVVASETGAGGSLVLRVSAEPRPSPPELTTGLPVVGAGTTDWRSRLTGD